MKRRMAASPKSKFDSRGSIEGLLGEDTSSSARIERIFELFGDPKDEQPFCNIHAMR